MGAVVPSLVPSRASQGERRLHRLLGGLPDGCVTYYEPDVDGRHPDFVVLVPTVGVLVIEAKGWWSSRILGGDTHTVRIESPEGVPMRVIHPGRQARDYLFRLMDVARSTPFARRFLHADGPHEGRFRFPFAHLVALTNMTASQLDSCRAPSSTAVLRELFPARRTVTRDDLDRWETLDSEQLLDELRVRFEPRWAIDPMTEDEVRALRVIIHPEILLENRVSLDALDETPIPMSEQRGVVEALDLRQEDFAAAIGTGHRILYGVAGSGKTLLLLARARELLRRDSQASILLTCYNRMLAEWLQERLSVEVRSGRVTVRTFHALAMGAGVDWRRHGSDDAAFGAAFLAFLRSGDSRGARRFDAVLVDEGQDFEPSWFRCLLAMMRDPDDGDLLIVADGAQGLYRRTAFTWSSLGIKARGRTASTRFRLDQNYRNSSEIIALAETFATTAGALGEAEPDDPDSGGGAVRISPERCVRSTGITPLFVRASGRRHELAVARRLVEGLLTGRWHDGRRIDPLAPHEIGILYPSATDSEKALLSDFADELSSSLAPACWVNGLHASMVVPARQSIRLMTIHAAKGLQFRAVLMLWIDQLPRRANVGDAARRAAERRLIYVGMTRSESFLVLTASKSSRFVSDVESAPAVQAVEAGILTGEPKALPKLAHTQRA